MEVLTNQQVPYLLTPVFAPPRLDQVTILTHVKDPKNELQFLFERNSQEPLIVDLETQGTKAFVSATAIVGIGFADSRGSLYVDLLTSSPATLPFLIRELDRLRVPLIAHNVAFDGVFLLRDSAKIWPETGGRWLNWVTCTYALYRHIATEKFIGQQYGLKKAQVDLLGWEESNEVELDAWLMENGYTTGKGQNLSPDKSQMWRAPAEILGKYCAMDCDSTFSLFHQVLNPVMDRFPKLRTYHETYFMRLEELLARQQLSGIKIDVPQLTLYREDLWCRTNLAAEIFLTLPRVRKFTEKKIKQEKLNLIADEPEKFKKKKERMEPVKFKKDGQVSSSWLSWERAESAPREITVAWRKWDQKVREFTGDGLFNINSDNQLRDLFYTELAYPITEMTETGLASVGVDALKGFGEEGKALDYFRELEKELQYVDGCLDYVALSDDKQTLHPVFRVPGTHTGRLSGGQGKNEKGPKVNVQQIPKSPGYLACWKPRPGMKWISIDWCLPPQVEILTKERGWISITSVAKEDKVWQVDHNTLEGSWTTPTRVVKKHYEGDLYIHGNRRGELPTTINHKMLWAGQQSSKGTKDTSRLREIKLSQERLVTNREFIISTNSISESYFSKEEIWQACMLQADGSKTGKNYRIEVSLPKKVTKVKELLGTDPIISKRGTSYWNQVKFDSVLLDKETKTLNLSALGTNQVEVFLEALQFWDGSSDKKAITYSSCKKENMDQLQSYLSRAGYECKVNITKRTFPHNDKYSIRIRKNNSFRVRPQDFRTEKYNGEVGCVEVPKGFILVRNKGQTFVTGNCALEGVVLAALSGDPSLLLLYGPGAKENDLHLFLGATIPGLKEPILAAGYDPKNPTPEGIANAKKLCKKERSIAKTANYALQYGAGVPSIHASLIREGIDATREMAQIIYDSYHELYKVSKQWARWLERFHGQSGGWVPTALGRPTTLWNEKLKDLASNVVQLSGHDVHILFCYLWSEEFRKAGIPFNGIVVDFHDESIIEVPESLTEISCELLLKAAHKVNEMLDCSVKLTAEPKVISSMAEAKCEG